MKCLLQVLIVMVIVANVAEAQYVQLAPPSGTSQTVTQQPGTSLNVNILNNQYVVGQGTYNTIQTAITAAGTTGSVLIPPTYQGRGSITAFSITSNVVTFTAANNFQSGELILASGLSIGTYLNGVSLTVLSTGLSSTQFEAAFTHANVTTTTDSGVALCCTDTWTNPNNIRITDLRVLNQNATTSYTGAPQPIATIKAADYGALCNGQGDDYPAIQAAINAVVTAEGGYETGPPGLMGPGVVELPQGHCELSQPLVLMNYGSIKGQGNNTWISAYGNFSYAAYINIVESYNQPQQASAWKRYVRDISFGYGGNAEPVTAIKVFNQIGSSMSYPYASSCTSGGSCLENAQLGGIEISGNYCYSMDTCIEVDDTNGANIFNNYGYYLRLGIWDRGNNYALVTRDNNFLSGSNTYTPTTTTSTAIFAESDARYQCASGSGPSCGTINQSLISSPQGIGIYGSTLEEFGTAANIGNATGFTASFTCFCDATAGPAVYIGNIVGMQFEFNGVSLAVAPATAMEIAAPPSPGQGLAKDNGWWIGPGNVFSAGASGGTTNGIYLDAGATPNTNPLQALQLINNQFYNFQNAIVLSAPVTQSLITGNNGNTNTDELIDLNATGATSFAQTVIENNTSNDSEKILVDTAGGGYVIGYNSSTSQWTGTQAVAQAGCTIAAGAIGNACNNTITFSTAGGFPMFNTSYRTVCNASGGSGLWTIGNPNTPTDTTVIVPSVALSTTASGGGFIACTITSVQ
jgi:hypothetical protein